MISARNKSSRKALLLLIGIFMFSCFIYIRIIRQCLPRDIPLGLSFGSFIILVSILFTYCYLFYKTMRPKSHSMIITLIHPILQTVFQPLLVLHKFLIKKKITKVIIYNLLVFYISFVNKKHYRHYDPYFYKIFFNLPQIVFLTALILDCFIFNQLYFIYSCTFVLLIPLILKYLLFSASAVKEYYCSIFDKDFIVEITSEDIIYKPEDYDDDGYLKIETPRYDLDPSMLDYDDNTTLEAGAIRYKYLFATKLIHYQSSVKCFNRGESLMYEYKILFLKERQDVIILSKVQKPTMTKERADKLLQNLIEINLLEDYIDIHTKDLYIWLLNIPRIVYILFIFCWSFILITSCYHNPVDFKMFIYYCKNFSNYFIIIGEPFALLEQHSFNENLITIENIKNLINILWNNISSRWQ